MRPHGSCGELEARRRLAVARLLEGYEADEVADFLGVEVRSVYRWLAAFRQAGPPLQAQPAPNPSNAELVEARAP